MCSREIVERAQGVACTVPKSPVPPELRLLVHTALNLDVIRTCSKLLPNFLTCSTGGAAHLTEQDELPGQGLLSIIGAVQVQYLVTLLTKEF